MGEKRRIGVNTLFHVPGDVGGTEIYLRQNLQAMARAGRGLTLVLFTTNANDTVLRDDLSGTGCVEFVRLNFSAANRPLRIVAEQTLLPQAVRRNNVDVLWSPGYTAPFWCSCPQAVTVHDLQYKSHPEDMTFLERRTLDFLVRSACRRSNAIIAVSEFSKEEIIRYDFAPRNRIFVVHEGVDGHFAQPGPKEATGDPAVNELLASDRKFILCVAQTYPHKNVHVLVDAFSLLRDKIPHHLVLVGNPRRGEKRLRQSLARFPHPDRIHRLSGLNAAELKRMYQQADCFVLPSVYEGFGLPVLEAMMAGAPVVALRKASIPEVGGSHAFYASENKPESFAEAISHVLQLTEAEKRSHVRRGRQWATSFTWQKSAAETIGILESLIIPHSG